MLHLDKLAMIISEFTANLSLKGIQLINLSNQVPCFGFKVEIFLFMHHVA